MSHDELITLRNGLEKLLGSGMLHGMTNHDVHSVMSAIATVNEVILDKASA